MKLRDRNINHLSYRRHSGSKDISPSSCGDSPGLSPAEAAPGWALAATIPASKPATALHMFSSCIALLQKYAKKERAAPSQSCPWSSSFPRNSEIGPSTELKCARREWRIRPKAGDVTKRSTTHCRIRVGVQNRMVQYVERFNANLELALSPHMESAKDAGIHVGHAGAAELIAMCIAKARSNDRRR